MAAPIAVPQPSVAPGMEPTPEEMQTLTDAAKIFAWIPMREPELEEVFAALGLHPDDPPRVVAMLNDDMIYEKILAMENYPPTRLARVAVRVEAARKEWVSDPP